MTVLHREVVNKTDTSFYVNIDKETFNSAPGTSRESPGRATKRKEWWSKVSNDTEVDRF